MSRQRGFSLLELLVVLFIAGLLSSLGVAWLDSGQSDARQALERLAAVARSQAGLAVHGGQITGLRWNGERPEWVRQVAAGQGVAWQVQALSLQTWPASLRPDWPAGDEPRLVFSPHGVARAEALRWRWQDGGEDWHWDALGRLQRTRLP